MNISNNMNSELFIAAKEGKIGGLRSALSNGSNIDERNDEGQTPLMIACKEGHTALVKFILSRSPNIDISDKKGKTVVDYIKESNCEELIDLIRVKDGDIKPEEDTETNENSSKQYINLADKLLPLLQQLVPLVQALDDSQKGIIKQDFIKIVQLFRDKTEFANLDIFGLGLTEVLFFHSGNMEMYFNNIKKDNSIENFIKEIYEVQKENYLSNATTISNFHLDSLSAFSAYSKIIDPDKLKRILYEFAEIMAKADDVVTNEESEKLKFKKSHLHSKWDFLLL